jgi:hypothetical protein
MTADHKRIKQHITANLTMLKFNKESLRKSEIAAYQNQLAYVTSKSLQIFLSFVVLNTMHLEEARTPETSVYIYRTRQCHFEKPFFRVRLLL